MFEVYDKQAVEGTEQHAEGKAEGQQIPKLLQLTGQKQMGALVEAVENVSAMPGEADPPLQLHSIRTAVSGCLPLHHWAQKEQTSYCSAIGMNPNVFEALKRNLF